MLRLMLRFAGALVCLALFASELAADDGGKVSGYMFGDYYYVAAADDAAATPEKRNAFQFRRIYATYDRGLSETFSVRFRLEANDDGFGGSDKMVPFVKHAYLRWNEAIAGADLYIGESGTPIWAISEKYWGYRSIAKTVLDLHKIGSSADIGLALKGGGGLQYHVMVANGPGQKPEDDNGKKLYASLSLSPAEGKVVELMGDYDMRPGGQDRITLKAFLGLRGDSFHGGIEPFLRIDKDASASTPGDDRTRSGVSAFGSLPVADDWKGFARLDVLSDDDGDTTDLLVIAGLDFAAHKDVHIMPNVFVAIPDGPDPSITLRASAFYKF